MSSNRGSVKLPRNATSVLRLGVIEARNLAPSGHTFSKASTVNAQIRFEGRKKKVASTRHSSDTLGPKWNEYFHFSSLPLSKVLRIELKDKVESAPGRRHSKGVVAFDPTKLEPYREQLEWYPLQKKKSNKVMGELLLHVYYSPEGVAQVESPTGGSFVFIEANQDSATSSEGFDDDDDEEEDYDELGDTESSSSSSSGGGGSGISSAESLNQSPTLTLSPSNLKSASTNVLPSSTSTSASTSSSLPTPTKSASLTSPLSSRTSRSATTLPASVSFNGSTAPTIILGSSGGATVSNVSTSSEGVEVENLDSPSGAHKEESPQSSDNSPSGRRSLLSSLRRRSSNDRSKKLEKKNKAFQKLFKLPETQTIITDFRCAYIKQSPLIIHGHLFVSASHIAFYSNLFGVKTIEKIASSDITEVQHRSGRFFQDGAQITVRSGQQFYFIRYSRSSSTLQQIFEKLRIHDTQSIEAAAALDESENSEEDDDAFLSSAAYDDAGFLKAEQMEEMLKVDFDISPGRFFNFFFADSAEEFLRKYHVDRGDTDLQINKWTEHTQYGNFREIVYRAPTNSSIGPKTTLLTETQRYNLQKDRLVVETTSLLHDVPYGDYFRVEGKWNVMKTETGCRLVMHVGAYFIKKTWFKSKIESSLYKTSKESYDLWHSIARTIIAKKSRVQKKGNVNGESSTVAQVTQVLENKVVVASGGNNSGSMRGILVYLLPLVILLLLLYVRIHTLSARLNTLEETLDDVRATLKLLLKENIH